jgi:hypothetical protein
MRDASLANPFPDPFIRHLHGPYQAFRNGKYPDGMDNKQRIE